MHPRVQQRVGRANPTGQQQTRIQNFMGTGQSQRPVRPPVAGGYAGGNMYGRPGVGGPPAQQPLQPQLPPQHPLMASVNPGMQSVINSRMQQGWSGDNADQQASLAAMAGQQMAPGNNSPYARFGTGMGGGGWQPMGSQPMQNTWGGMGYQQPFTGGQFYGGGGYGQMTGGGTQLGSGYGQVMAPGQMGSGMNYRQPFTGGQFYGGGLAGQMGSGGGMGGNFQPYAPRTGGPMYPVTYNSGGYAQRLAPGTTRSGGTYGPNPQVGGYM